MLENTPEIVEKILEDSPVTEGDILADKIPDQPETPRAAHPNAAISILLAAANKALEEAVVRQRELDAENRRLREVLFAPVKTLTRVFELDTKRPETLTAADVESDKLRAEGWTPVQITALSHNGQLLKVVTFERHQPPAAPAQPEQNAEHAAESAPPPTEAAETPAGEPEQPGQTVVDPLPDPALPTKEYARAVLKMHGLDSDAKNRLLRQHAVSSARQIYQANRLVPTYRPLLGASNG